MLFGAEINAKPILYNFLFVFYDSRTETVVNRQ